MLCKELDSTRIAFAKVRLLRNTGLAHRSKTGSYNDMFKRAGITPDELEGLVITCVKIANELRLEVGLPTEEPSSFPVERYERMLRQLAD